MAEYLFSSSDLSEALAQNGARLDAEIASLSREALDRMPADELAEQLRVKHLIEMVGLSEGDISARTDEVDVKVRDDWDRVSIDRGAAHSFRGARVTYYLPFTGDPGVLSARTNPYTSAPPEGRVEGSEIHWEFSGIDPNPERVRSAFESNLSKIRQYLEWAGSQVDGYNRGLPERIASALAERRSKLDTHRALAEGLGVKARQMVSGAAISEIERPDQSKEPAARPRTDPPKTTAEGVRLAGEGKTTEFKSSLRWDYHQSKINKALQEEVVEAIAGFLNSNGGDLLIGVRDDRTVLGLQPDLSSLGSVDAFQRTIVSLIADLLGLEFGEDVEIGFDDLEGQQICHIRVGRAGKPAYLRTELFVRVGPTTRKFSARDSVEYVKKHWSA